MTTIKYTNFIYIYTLSLSVSLVDFNVCSNGDIWLCETTNSHIIVMLAKTQNSVCIQISLTIVIMFLYFYICHIPFS